MKFTERLLSKNLYNKENTTAVSIGNIGEETAVKALKKCGYKIIARNYRTKMGEISIHAEEVTLLSKSLQILPEKYQ